MQTETRYRAARIIITVFVFLLFILMFVPFFFPLLMALLVAFALDPIISRYAVKKSKRKLPAVVLLIGFFLLTAGPITLVFFRFSAKVREISKKGIENTEFYQAAEKLFAWGTETFASWSDKLGMSSENATAPEQANDLIPKAANFILTQLGNLASSTPEFLLMLLVFSLALYFFITESKRIGRVVAELDILPGHELNQIIKELQKGSYVTLFTSAITGVIQATVVATSCLFFGYQEFFLIFVITFFVSFIPVIGAAPVAYFFAAVSFVHGDTGAGIGLLILGAIAGTIDNVVRPLLATSDEGDISPAVSLLAIIGAVIVFGFTGIFLGPVITRLAYRIVPILYKKLDRPHPGV